MCEANKAPGNVEFMSTKTCFKLFLTSEGRLILVCGTGSKEELSAQKLWKQRNNFTTIVSKLASLSKSSPRVLFFFNMPGEGTDC